MKKTEWKSPALLFLTAVVWGVAFVAQSVGMDYVGPFTFNCIRCLIGAVVLVPCIWFLDRWKQRPDGASCGREAAGAQGGASDGGHALLAGGICCGLALFVASNLQQIGIQYTTVGKAGFITALYIVMVPVFGIFLKKRAGIRVWVSVALAVAGLYLLCITDRLALGKGDILVLLCAVVFAVHILVVDHFSAKTDGVRMSCIQFLVCGLLSGVCMLITEHPEMRLILQAWQPILYAGVFSCGVGYTLQIVGQKGVDPTAAALILSLESVVATISGYVAYRVGFLKTDQTMTARQIAGCAVVFTAVILVQLPWERISQKFREKQKQ